MNSAKPKNENVIFKERFINSANEVICSKCGERLWKFVGEAVPGTMIKAKDFISLSKMIKSPINGEKIKCLCGAEYSWLKQDWYYPKGFYDASKSPTNEV